LSILGKIADGSTAAVIRQTIAVMGVVAAVSGGAAASAWAVTGQPGQGGGTAVTGLVPRSGEWWLTTWKMQPVVWPLTRGVGVTVAVLDSGVQATVPDLRGAVLPGGDVTGHHTNGETDFNTDGDGHGTMMAVLIAGQGHGTGMIGMAPEAKILPVVVNAGLSDTASPPGAVAAGIIYAANHGADVIDVPQEYPSPAALACDPALQRAVAYAVARNIVVVAAAGDASRIGTGPAEPASCAGVVAVGAVGPNRSLWSGNTRQPYLTVVNPGADLITSGREGQLVTGVSGTRAASALAAGAVALIRSRYPKMPWYQVVQRLTATALPEGGQVPNDSFGYGIFKLSFAVNATAHPVPASATNPVYARYQSWLASPQGQALARPPAASAAPRASATPRAAGSPALVLTVVLTLLAAACAAVVLAERARRKQEAPRRHRLPRGTSPARAGEPGEPYAGTRLLEEVPPDGYLLFGEGTPYRIPPYTRAASPPPVETGR
jgi:subtilisin family serine protease